MGVCAGYALNGMLDAGEQCDPPGQQAQCAAGFVCNGTCQCSALCGNGVIDPGEQCDPPGQQAQCAAGFVCTGCQCTPLCGNGTLNPGEQCDPPGQQAQCAAGQVCNSSCQCSVACGNGVLDAGEQCDPPGQQAQCPVGRVCAAACQCTLCGNGVLDAGEQCDPPGQQVQCAAGQLCNGSCQCATGCCGFPGAGPAKLRFETVTGSGSVPGNQYHVGTGNITLARGGLYFGGSGETVPLPSVVPDKGVSFLGTTCNVGGPSLTLGPQTAAQTGSIRTCTSPVGICTAAAAGTCSTATFTCTGTGICGGGGTCTHGKIGLACAANSDCDFDCGNDRECDTCTAGNVGAHCNTTKGGDHQCACLFGPPLPLPNSAVPNTSACVISTLGNRFNTIVSGSGDCVQGSSSVSLPLNSEVYLTGDLLPKRCTAGPNAGFSCVTNASCPGGVCAHDPGIEPCPICNPTTLRCDGGPNEGAACTPGTSAITGHPEYPTSHDCPPPHVGAEIGGLPIAFSLTTGMAAKTSFSTGPGNGKSNIFCALCKDPLGNFENPPFPANGCTSDAQCIHAPFTSCEQNLNGAFQHADADSITEVGEPAGDLTGGAMKPSTLVGVFCIPPAYDSTTDTNDGLLGPAAVSMPGMAQLLP